MICHIIPHPPPPLFSRWFETFGGNQVQQVHLHRGHVPGAAELHREPAGDFVHDGVGVVRKRDGQRHRCAAQTQVTLLVIKTVSKWPKDKYLTAVTIKCGRNLEYLFLSDLPGIADKQKTVERLQTALPRLDLTMDLD